MAACSGGGFLLTLGGQPRPNGGEVWGGGVPQDLILTLVGQYMNIYLLYLCCSAWLYFFRFWGSKMRVLVHPGCYFLQLINLNGNTRYTRPGWGGTDMWSNLVNSLATDKIQKRNGKKIISFQFLPITGDIACPAVIRVRVRGGRSNYFHGLGSTDYFYESNHYFLPVTLDPITFQFHCDMGWVVASPSIHRTPSAADWCMCIQKSPCVM